jgi:tetratricopeptide (TPR) repeat protein
LLAGALTALPLAATLATAQVEPRRAAIAAFQRNDLEAAERLSLEWIRDHPRDQEIFRLLGMVRITAGLGLEKGERPRSEVQAVYRRALDALLEAERLAGGRPQPDLNHAVGYILLSQGRFEEAADRLTRAIAETPETFVLYRLRGTCRMELGSYREAEVDLRRAAELGPGDLAAHLLHAKTLALLGREEEARDSLRAYYRSIEPEPEGERHVRTMYEIYRHSMQMNDFEGARQAIEKARRAAPADPTIRCELGILYYRTGEHEAAGPELDAVLAEPSAGDDLRADAHHYRGLLARQAGRLADARRDFEAALALSPNRAETLQSYGATLRRLGEMEKARGVLSHFERVVGFENDVKRLETQLALEPRDRHSRVALIRVLLRLGRRARASTQLDELRRRFPDDPALPALESEVADAR